MTVVSPAPVPPAPPHDATGGASDLRSLTIVCYVLFLLAAVNGVTALIGVIIAYAKRGDAAGTIWQSHFNNLILTFWVMVGAALVAVLMWPIAFGALLAAGPIFWPPALTLPFAFWFLGIPLVVVWYFYRGVRGLMRASEERAY